MITQHHIKKFILTNKKSLILFVLVGGCTALLYVSLFTLLWKILSLNYQIAVSISYLIAVIFYFLAHRKFTFKNSNNSMKQQIPRYITMLVFNYLTTLIVMHGVVEALSLPPPVGIITAIGITFALNYLISRFWIFKKAY